MSDTPSPHPASEPTGDEFLRIERVARILDVSRKWIYRLIQQKRIEVIRFGPHHMRIPRRALEDFITEHLTRIEERG